MQVALNDDSEYAGGRLVFATRNGFIVPRRPAGSATIHTNDIVHGVTALHSGVRYGLFFCDTQSGECEWSQQEKAKSLLEFLLPNAVKQFQFSERAEDAILNLSDDELYACQQSYAAEYAEDEDKSTAVFACEVLKYVHTLHPTLYSRTRASSTPIANAADCLGIDLVAKSRRHVIFMQDLLDIRNQGDCNETTIAAACVEYVKFLTSLQTSNSNKEVPSLLVDHIWHTHMAFPDRYSSDCIQLCGFEVDHVVL